MHRHMFLILGVENAIRWEQRSFMQMHKHAIHTSIHVCLPLYSHKAPLFIFFKQSWFSCYISSPSFPVHLLLLINSGLVQVSYNYWVGLYFCLNRKFYAKQNVCICFFYADILHALVFIIYCLNLYPE